MKTYKVFIAERWAGNIKYYIVFSNVFGTTRSWIEPLSSPVHRPNALPLG